MRRLRRLVAPHGLSLAALWAPILLLLPLVNALVRKGPWRYEWGLTSDTIAYSCVFAAPVLAGAAAWELRRLTAVRDSIARAPRGRAALLTAPLLLVALYLAGLLLALAVMGTIVVATTHLGPRPWELAELLVALLVGAVGASLGAVMGWWFPSRLTPALALLSVFGLVMASFIVGGGAGVLSAGGGKGSAVGIRLSLPVLAWRLAGGLVITGVGTWFLLRSRRRTLTSVERIGACLAVIVLIFPGTFALGGLSGGNRFVGDPTQKVSCEPMGDSGNPKGGVWGWLHHFGDRSGCGSWSCSWGAGSCAGVGAGAGGFVGVGGCSGAGVGPPDGDGVDAS